MSLPYNMHEYVKQDYDHRRALFLVLLSVFVAMTAYFMVTGSFLINSDRQQTKTTKERSRHLWKDASGLDSDVGSDFGSNLGSDLGSDPEPDYHTQSANTFLHKDFQSESENKGSPVKIITGDHEHDEIPSPQNEAGINDTAYFLRESHNSSTKKGTLRATIQRRADWKLHNPTEDEEDNETELVGSGPTRDIPTDPNAPQRRRLIGLGRTRKEVQG
ncbi:uncharacterized protein PV09_04848 [Verruconis gallopava]|uniref:Uncharacterized protein n=1 Tax=Verruconis gallopava TaxID=253628 RepID=A0A0D2AC04_9PEZI|nr:uncharacterized protein PV09_04848 [Verruconis gallopava]KIW04025.1 hypothetical protein PV09_04848 [Verruconis gallopava]